MRNLTAFFSLFLCMVSVKAVQFDDGTYWECGDVKKPVALRYGYQYRFFDVFKSNSSNRLFLQSFAVRYKNSKYLAQGESYPNGEFFWWSKELMQNNYAVDNKTKFMVISTYKNDWAVLHHPAARGRLSSNDYDFMIAYRYDYVVGNESSSASYFHSTVTCQPYYITWLGDGVIDVPYEVCDPGDESRSSWGMRGCDGSDGTPLN